MLKLSGFPGGLFACDGGVDSRWNNAFEVVWMDKGERLERPSVVCLGFFDGVHLGHRKLIDTAIEIGRREGLASCVHTFSQMPAKALHPERDHLELTTLPEKLRLFQEAGLDAAAISEFNEEMRTMHARDFLENRLIAGLNARHVVAGYDHRFGYLGECGTDMLSALCAELHIGLTVVGPVRLDGGEVISSTAIRRAIREGDYALAERMLGRPCPEAMRRRDGK